MIFVTVGTTAFPRLIKKMDDIAGEIDEPVVMQIGYTKYSCKNAQCTQFLNYDDIVISFQQARIIVCHDGVGTIITALQFDKPIIAVPRLQKYGEIYFDNKGDVIDALAGKGRITALYNVDELNSALRNVDLAVTYMKSDDRLSLISTLSKYINQLHMQKVNRRRFINNSG